MSFIGTGFVLKEFFDALAVEGRFAASLGASGDKQA